MRGLRHTRGIYRPRQKPVLRHQLPADVPPRRQWSCGQWLLTREERMGHPNTHAPLRWGVLAAGEPGYRTR